MQKTLLRVILGIGVCMPIFVHAAEESGYIWQSMGLDFYSVIDDGQYTLVKQMVAVELKKTPTLGDFGAGCPLIEQISSESTSEDLLNNGTVSLKKLSELLAKNGIQSVDMDVYQGLILCLEWQYATLKSKKQSEINTLQKMGSIWLYTDGDTKNSDYDLLDDINKINTILFSSEGKYQGVINSSASDFASYLAGKAAPPLFGDTGTGTDTGTGGESDNGTDSGTGIISPIIGELCSINNTPIPLDQIMDEDFMNELSHIIGGGTDNDGGSDRSEESQRENTGGTNTGWALTSASDYYDSPGTCEGPFCVDVRMVSGNNNLLWGWKNNTSIEWLIEKHNTILEPIAAWNLACQKMTNDFWENATKAKYTDSFAWLQVYYNTKPNLMKKYANETTGTSLDNELLAMQRCVYAKNGLPTDIISANGPRVSGFMQNSANNTTNIQWRILSTNPQNPDDSQLWASCYQYYTDESRKVYFSSFMGDVADFETFSRSILEVIRDIINIGTQMDKKPVWC